MKIKIEKIESDELVRFSTSIGTGIGLWAGNKKLELNEFFAEFDFTISLKLGENASIVKDNNLFIRYNEGLNEIQGLVESKDEDGLIYLRLSVDNIVMIENDHESIKPGDYLLIRLDPLELEIYAM